MPTLNLGRVRFNWRDAYDPNTNYLEYDCVEDDGQSYVCTEPVTGTGPNDASGGDYWGSMLVRSADYNAARDQALQAASNAEDAATAAADSETNAAGSAQTALEQANRAESEADRATTYADNAGYVTRQRLAEQSTLGLNFARGKYLVDDGELIETTNASEILSVERASPKWVMGPNGKLREVPPNTIAREWRNGVCQGALIEEERTNLILRSSDSTASEWTQTVGWTRSRSTEVGSPESATGECDKLVSDMSGPGNFARQNANISGSAGGQYTASLYIYIPSGQVASHLAVASDFDDFSDMLSSEIVEDSWVRASMTIVAEDDIGNVDFKLVESDGSGFTLPSGFTLYTYGFQLEEGSSPFSYTPTTDSPVTRAADLNYRDLGSELNPSGFTQVIRFTAILPMRIGGLFTVGSKKSSYDSDKARSGLRVIGSTTLSGEVLTDGGDRIYQRGEHQLDVVAGVNTVAMAVDPPSGIIRIALNGEVKEKITNPFTMSELTRLWLDHSGGTSNYFYHQAGLYPYALSATELEELTS